MERVDWLKKVSIFKDISLEGLKSIDKLLDSRRYHSGQVIYSEGERGGSLYLIMRGKIRVYRTGKNMTEVELAHLKEGDVFGEMTFLDESPHTASIAAIEDTEVLVLDKARFEELVKYSPKLAYLITRNLLLLIESILRRMNAEYVSLMEYMYVFGK